MDISVIVPVYNTSRYLRQCIDSLINQTWKDVEFIFVDDGSTDDSLEILKEYQKMDARIKVLEQQNMHAGVARNNGMKQATGKYVIFLDSDDYFELNLLEKAFRCAEKNRAEIVLFGHYNYDNKTGETKKYPFKMRHGVFSGEILGDDMFISFEVVPWNKLYLKSFLDNHHIEYQQIHRHEDVYFVILSIVLAERIVCLNKRLVYYRINNPESQQRRKMNAYPYLIECYTELKKNLIALGRFHGNTRNAYNKCVSESIERRTRLKPEVMLSKQYYSEMKKNLVPNLFESYEDFAADTVIPGVIYESDDYDHYVFLLFERLVKNQKKDIVSVKSKDYIVGHALLALPRLIMNAVWPEDK